MKLALIAAITMTLVALQTNAQERHMPASAGWGSSYGFASPSERNSRLSLTVEQEKLKRGYYDRSSTVITTNNNITYNTDHSVTNTIDAGEGASVDVENRTAENSGTSSYVVGAINESTTNISTEGSGTSSINVSNGADSQGCIDGGISSNYTRPVGAMDISSGGLNTGITGGVSVSRGDC